MQHHATYAFGPLLAKAARPTLDPARERELLLAAGHGDDAARAELVGAHLRLVASVARRVTRRPCPDTLAEGLVGLLEAIHRFDTSRDLRLATYATHWIRARVQRFVLGNRGIVRAPDTRASRRAFGQLGRAQRLLASRTSRPTSEDIAHVVGVDTATVEGVLASLRGHDVPIDTTDPGGEGPETTFERGPEERVAEVELDAARRRVIEAAVAALPARERRIIETRTLAAEGPTLDRLATTLSLSRERVRQLEVRALRSIGRALTIEGLAPEFVYQDPAKMKQGRA